MSLLPRRLLALALLPLCLVWAHAAAPSSARHAGDLRVPAAIDAVSPGAGASSPDRPVTAIALSDGADPAGEGLPPRAADWKTVHPRRADAGFERRIRLPRPPAPSKWFRRAWGQP